MLRRRVITGLVAAAVVSSIALAGCSSPTGGGSNRPSVVAALYPYTFAAERVAGEHADVTNLTGSGADAHDLELTPKQVGSISMADLVVYQSGFQAAIDEAVTQNTPKNVVDVSELVTFREGHAHDHDHEADDPKADASQEELDHDDHDHDGEDHDHGGKDPHVWLDPNNIAKVADQIAEKLASIDAANADSYQANAEALKKDLATLDNAFRTGLAQCEIDTIIVSHEAFGYLTDRFNLNQIGVAGLDPEAQPSPASIKAAQQAAKTHAVTTIFFEQAASPKVARTIAKDLKIETDILDPLEQLSEDARGSDYIKVMEANLESLRKANRCK